MILRKSAATIAEAPIVELEPEILIDPSQPRTYASSLRQVGSGAISLVAGTGGIGALLTKHAVVLTKKGIDKVRQSGVDIAALAAGDDTPAAEKAGRSRLGRRLIIGGTIAATLATGAAVFRWSRQRSAAPPVADAPPTLGPSANGSAPAKASSAEVAH